MLDLEFYNAGYHEPRGLRRVVVPFRRLLRRLLRPIFLRQVELFQYLIDRLDASEVSLRSIRADVDGLTRRQDELDEQVQTVLAFGWDHVAMGRRLAVLEEQLAALTGQSGPAPDEADRPLSVLFPSHDPALESRSKVC